MALKDLWAQGGNPHKTREKGSLEHLTHWNAEHTRGVRIDRMYANFHIDGKVEVSTHHHVTSDHRGIFLSVSRRNEGATLAPPSDRIPHRAFDLPKVKAFTIAAMGTFVANPGTGKDTLAKWDSVKSRIA
jgi:hypothetical protein